MKNIQLEADEHGFFGEYGGKYVPETLMPAIEELKKAYDAAKQDPEFQRDYHHYLKHYVGRENAAYVCRFLHESIRWRENLFET